MIKKVTDLLNSLRFWQVTAAAALVLAGHYFPDPFLWNTLATWLATVAGIGTLDSIATKMGASDSVVNVGNPSDTSTVTVNTAVPSNDPLSTV